MLGPKITTVFRSRWNALFWAAGMMLTAYCSVPDENGEQGANSIVKAATAMAGHHAPEKHTNPWALHDAKPAN